MQESVSQQALDATLALVGKAEGVISEMAPHIWAAEVTYWRVQGILSWCLPIATVAIVAACVKQSGAFEKRRKSHLDENWWACGGIFVCAIGGIGSLVAIMLVGAAAFAPEMYAIRDLLSLLK